MSSFIHPLVRYPIMMIEVQTSLPIEKNILKGSTVVFPPGDGNIGKRVLSTLKKNPSFVGLVDSSTEESSTYGKLADESIRCALWLKKQKIQPGSDIIAIYSPSSISVLAPYLAVLYVGATVIVRPPDLPEEITRFYMNQLKPKIIFVSKESVENLNNILQEEKIDAKIIVLGNKPGYKSFNDIIKEQSLEEVEGFQCRTVDPNDIAVLIMSSGSTGVPKCIQHSYAGVLDTVQTRMYHVHVERKFVKTSLAAMGGIVSMAHIFYSLLSVSQYIIMHRPTVEELCRKIEKYKIQQTDLTTDVCYKLSKSDFSSKYDLSSLKIAGIAGSVLRKGVMEVISRMIPNCQLISGYGMTEAGFIYMETTEKGGQLCCNVKIKVVDLKSGEALEANQRGEVCLKTPCMMKGYYKNEIATKKAFDSEGWFHTGDLGYYDEKGNLRFVGRIEMMINYKNQLLSPTEIEEFLLKHPDVVDAVVVPVPHDHDGQHAIGFVEKKKDSNVTEKDLVEYSSSLDENKMLRGGVIFVEEIPFTVTGKLCRKEMLKMLKKND